MKLKKSEHDHIKAVEKKWPAVLAAASRSVRQDNRLVGLDKIRNPIAIRAALFATGYDDDLFGFTVPESAGEVTREIQQIADQVFDLAFDKAAEVARSLA